MHRTPRTLPLLLALGVAFSLPAFAADNAVKDAETRRQRYAGREGGREVADEGQRSRRAQDRARVGAQRHRAELEDDDRQEGPAGVGVRPEGRKLAERSSSFRSTPIPVASCRRASRAPRRRRKRRSPSESATRARSVTRGRELRRYARARSGRRPACSAPGPAPRGRGTACSCPGFAANRAAPSSVARVEDADSPPRRPPRSVGGAKPEDRRRRRRDAGERARHRHARPPPPI